MILINIIAVDDERSALWLLRKAIEKAAPKATVTCFEKARNALEYAGENMVDIAFLDIEMAGMNGLILAKHLKDLYGETNIIFVTGYSEYAGNAFGLRASGYVLKPINANRVADELEHLRHPVRLRTDGIYIQTFGNFDILVDGVPLVFPRTKSKEALAYLVHKRGRRVTRKELAAALWPEDEYSRAKQAHLQITLTEMMKPLQKAGAESVVQKIQMAYAIDPQQVNCDYFRLLEWDTKAVNKYKGNYMPEYPWAVLEIDQEGPQRIDDS